MQRFKKIFNFAVIASVAMQILGIGGVAMAGSAGDVVINEIAWAGSADNSVDEWIELYNTTSQSVDLAGWYIEDDGTTVYLIESGTIGPHSYFLIEDSENAVGSVGADAVIGLSLANAGDSLVLKDGSDSIIDIVNGSGGAWYAGDSTSKATMERIDPDVTTDSAENWADAVSSNGATGSSGGEILGTPGGANSNYGGSGPMVFISPENVSVENGEQFTVSVEVDQATDLYAYGFEINYDPTVLNYASAAESNFLKAGGISTVFNAALEGGNEGTLIVGNARIVNPPQGVDGSGKLVDVTFDVVGNDGSASALSFGSGSFLSDSVSDMPAGYTGSNVTVGTVGGVSPVTNLQTAEATERYSIELSWANPDGADSYIIQRQNVDGNFVNLGETGELNFVDDLNIVPEVIYSYRVIAVKGGAQSSAAEVSGMETRGLSGDVNRSGRVDGRDIELLARAYGSEFIDEEYDPLFDTNFDGVIDGSDLINIGANFGLVY
ncbi:MAG: lamin tail domain-containing protein [Candidatus Peregrinibacteria bacterium]